MTQLPLEEFPALSAIGTCRHAFTQRIPGIDVSHDKAEVLKRLDSSHRAIQLAVGMGDWTLFTAQQIHGNKVAVVDSSSHGVEGREFSGCDGLITNQRGIALGVYVADCCAVYVIDPKNPAIGLVHSGRKGTELSVVPNAITQMIDRFGSDPANMIVQLSPCIRPPHYEVDFVAEILRRCRADRKSTRLNSSHVRISYAVFCLKKKKKKDTVIQTRKKKRKTQDKNK